MLYQGRLLEGVHGAVSTFYTKRNRPYRAAHYRYATTVTVLPSYRYATTVTVLPSYRYAPTVTPLPLRPYRYDPTVITLPLRQPAVCLSAATKKFWCFVFRLFLLACGFFSGGRRRQQEQEQQKQQSKQSKQQQVG